MSTQVKPRYHVLYSNGSHYVHALQDIMKSTKLHVVQSPMDSTMDGHPKGEVSSGRLTEHVLKEIMGKPSKNKKIAVENIAKLHHEMLKFNRARALTTVDESIDSILEDMNYFEGQCSKFFQMVDKLPLISPIVPYLDDIWFGYQQCARRMYGHLKMEVGMVGEQVNEFKFDMEIFEQKCMKEIQNREVNVKTEVNESLEHEHPPSPKSDIEQADRVLHIESENAQLREEISRIEYDNSKTMQENNVLMNKISEMRNTLQDMELNQSCLTPRPVDSVDDLVEILGDESVANKADNMVKTLYEKGENVAEFFETHLKEIGIDLPELGEFTNVWRDIIQAQCDPDALTAALTRRVGSTSQKFKFLENQCIHLQRENREIKHQLAYFLEMEEKRSLAKQRHDEEVHSERKNSIQRYLDMLADKGEDAWKDQLIGMGTGSDIPKLFRFVGKIRNKHMSKRDTEKLVREVWKDRSTTSSVKNTSLVDFLGYHLQKKVGIAAAVLELGYNFLFSLWRYQWDADCELFLKILAGVTREDVYIAQNNLQVDLEEMFEALDKANRLSTGYIPKEELTIALRAFFRVGKLDGKSEKRFEEALHALDVDHPGSQVEWRKVFEEDREFNQGEFAECVRDQFLMEREELYDAIGVALYEECGDNTSCSCSQLATALIVARPTLGEKAKTHASALFQELGEERLKISVALKFLSDRSLESSEDEIHQSAQRKQKADKPGLGGKATRQTVLQKRQNPLIASALEEVRLFWLASTH